GRPTQPRGRRADGMNDTRTPDRLLAAWFTSEAPASAPDALRTDIIRATAAIRPRPAWLARLRGNPMDVIVGGAGRRNSRLVPVLIILGILLALAIGAIYVGSPRPDDQLTVVPPLPSSSIDAPTTHASTPSASPAATPVPGLTALLADTQLRAGGQHDS